MKHYDNLYYKIGLIKSRLLITAVILTIILIFLILFFGSDTGYDMIFSPDKKQGLQIIIGVLLFGVFGGAYSTAVNSGKSTDEANISELISSKPVSYLRIVIGAVSALIVFFFSRQMLSISGN